MDPELRPTLLKLALPLGCIVLILAISRLRRIDFKRGLGLSWPASRALFLWLAIWIAWVAASEIVSRHFGFGAAAPWKPYAPAIVALRILAIGICGPAAEELAVRGILFYRLRLTRLGPYGAIVLCAGAWALMHYRYDAPTIALVFCDGLILGLARYRSDSTVLAMILHSLGNLYSIHQSLQG